MKQLFIKMENFRNSIERFIIVEFSPAPSSENRNNYLELFMDGLKLSYTIEEVLKIEELLWLAKNEFSEDEFINFNIEIKYRIECIKLMERYFPIDRTYKFNEFAAMFRNATYIECDALLLHITVNQHLYKHRPDGLRIYKTLYANRKSAIKFSLQHGCKNT